MTKKLFAGIVASGFALSGLIGTGYCLNEIVEFLKPRKGIETAVTSESVPTSTYVAKIKPIQKDTEEKPENNEAWQAKLEGYKEDFRKEQRQINDIIRNALYKSDEHLHWQLSRAMKFPLHFEEDAPDVYRERVDLIVGALSRVYDYESKKRVSWPVGKEMHWIKGEYAREAIAQELTRIYDKRGQVSIKHMPRGSKFLTEWYDSNNHLERKTEIAIQAIGRTEANTEVIQRYVSDENIRLKEFKTFLAPIIKGGFTSMPHYSISEEVKRDAIQAIDNAINIRNDSEFSEKWSHIRNKLSG